LQNLDVAIANRFDQDEKWPKSSLDGMRNFKLLSVFMLFMYQILCCTTC